jgi:hypothetical protein
MTITLSSAELVAITGYEQATKQVNVLHNRGFNRAFINRNGVLVLERKHYEAVCLGNTPATTVAKSSANFGHLRRAA